LSEEEQVEIESDELFAVEVKGKVDPIWRLQRQLERCNIIGSTGVEEEFERAVEVLYSELPLHIKQAVDRREHEFRGVEKKRVPVVFAGVPITNSDMIKPKNIEEEIVDYFKLFEIIKEEIEKAKLSWEYKEEHKALKAIPEPIPEEILNVARDVVKGFLEDLEKKSGKTVLYKNLLAQLLQKKTPEPKMEGENLNE